MRSPHLAAPTKIDHNIPYLCSMSYPIMMKLFFFSAWLLVQAAIQTYFTGEKPVSATFQNIRIDENALGGFGPCEPSIAISPANPDRIVAGAVLDQVYYSHDGGKTWTKKRLRSTYGVWGDPCIVADYRGNFFFFHLSNPTGRGWESPELLDRIVCQRSADGGKTWNNGSYMGHHHPKDQDKEWAVANPFNHELYTTWTQFDRYASTEPTDHTNILFAKSVDGGLSWSEAKAINQFKGICIDDDGATEGAVPAVGPNGEVYVAWALDGKIYFDRSADGGGTWLETDLVAAEQVGGWSIDIPGVGRANGMPVTGCDISNGPHRGTIYINFADQRNGEEDTDIWMVRSTDGGDSWSEPVRVNNDPPGKQQFFTWMAVDPVTGHVYVVFYDRRAYDNHLTDVYLAVSKNGGETFENLKISDKPFLCEENGVFFGDYNNISAYSGRVRPIWTRQDGSTLSIWTALVDF